ncbi:MAG: AAA family ATPase [Gammaproteobacteria bacterium]
MEIKDPMPNTAIATVNRNTALWTPAQANFDFVKFSDLSDEPLSYRIPGILPMNTNVLFSAYAKSGKTTTVLALVRALTSPADFLDLSCMTVSGRVIYVNFELTDQMLRKYATDAGLKLDSDRLRVWQLQGKAGGFKINDPGFQDMFAERLKEADCEVMILDPLAPVISMLGYKEEDNSA